jgi:hypothetical protein
MDKRDSSSRCKDPSKWFSPIAAALLLPQPTPSREESAYIEDHSSHDLTENSIQVDPLKK